MLLRRFEWGGQAHSVLIELLLGVGIIGLAMAVASFVTVGVRALSARHAMHRVVGVVEAAVFVHLIVVGVVEAALVIPGFAYVMLTLLFVAVSDPNIVDRLESRPDSSTVDVGRGNRARRRSALDRISSGGRNP
jgi:O-antigen ligase